MNDPSPACPCWKRMIPNLLTLARLVMAPFVFYCIQQKHYAAGTLLFMAACATDWLDGFSARRLKCSSKTGACFDPIADKIFAFCTYLALYHDITFLFWLIVGRDICIVLGAGCVLLWNLDLDIKPLQISKINTAFLLFLPFIWMLQHLFAWTSWPGAFLSMKIIIATTTILSGIGYAKVLVRSLRHKFCKKRPCSQQ